MFNPDEPFVKAFVKAHEVEEISKVFFRLKTQSNLIVSSEFLHYGKERFPHAKMIQVCQFSFCDSEQEEAFFLPNLVSKERLDQALVVQKKPTFFIVSHYKYKIKYNRPGT